MPKTSQPVEVNNFVGGLVTEASPLNFPPNASVDEDNCILNRDGTRDRRLGIDYESGYDERTTGLVPSNTTNTVFAAYTWKDAGGEAGQDILVVQIGSKIYLYRMDVFPYSPNYFTQLFDLAEEDVQCSFTTVDGVLVVVSGGRFIRTVIYKSNGNIELGGGYLLIRDLFGVESIGDSLTLTEPENLTYRPENLTQAHLYNLRNQTFGFGWPSFDTGYNPAQDYQDPIQMFRLASGLINGVLRYPSNADSVIDHLFNDPARSPYQLYYTPEEQHVSLLPNTPAPKGAFVIDALQRGSSRLAAAERLQDTDQARECFTSIISSVPQDTTPGGPTSVVEAAGRVFFAGFSNEIQGGDSLSPKMGSYVLFSKVVQAPSDIFQCYQAGDPTSVDTPDLLATDGGFLRVAGAYGIKGLVNINEGVLVIAENGVWFIRGGNDFAFSADNFQVSKISNRGCISKRSIVEAGGVVFFWGEDGVYQIAPDATTGNLQVVNISTPRIKRFYDQIASTDKLFADGIYDPYSRQIRWLYGNHLRSPLAAAKELILDQDLQAFSTSSTQELTGTTPRLVSPFSVPPFTVNSLSEVVTVNGVDVQAALEDVTVSSEIRESSLSSIYYVTVTDTDPSIKVTFSSYRDQDFLDWKSADGTGADAPAYLVTGAFTGQESQRRKQAKHLTVHSVRTENGFELDGEEIVASNPSSVIVQSQWDFANSAASGKWGTPFQAYRYHRHYIPEDVNDPYDYGYETIVTKNKLRGRGRALALKFSSEPLKDFRLIGWAHDMEINNAV